MLCSDRDHVDEHSLDEFDAIVFVEHAGLDHSVDVRDRQAMHWRGDGGHAKRLAPVTLTASAQAQDGADAPHRAVTSA
jgi:hypothetical protein